MVNILKLSLALILTFLIYSCNGVVRKAGKSESAKEDAISPATFDADSAFYFVKEQADFSPRVPNTEAHGNCAVWLEATLKKYCKDVKIQSFQAKAFDQTTLSLKNLIASYNTGNSKRILLCAHWDSRPFADHDPDPANHTKPVPGVNDGASGVGVLLEIARQFSIKSPNIGVDIILFDGEDYGAPENSNSSVENDWALGSQYWAENPHVTGYNARYGILLDMVGATGAIFTMEGNSIYYAPDITRKTWRMASKLGYDNYFSNDHTGSITDDHYYINEKTKIPTIDIIQHDPTTTSGFYKNWHTIHDDINGIDKETLKAVGETVITLVYNEK